MPDRMVGADNQDWHLQLSEDDSDDEEQGAAGKQPELILGEGGDVSVVGGDASEDRDHREGESPGGGGSKSHASQDRGQTSEVRDQIDVGSESDP